MTSSIKTILLLNSEVSEDSEVFSAAKVRERFKSVLKCDDPEKRITNN